MWNANIDIDGYGKEMKTNSSGKISFKTKSKIILKLRWLKSCCIDDVAKTKPVILKLNKTDELGWILIFAQMFFTYL